MTPMNKTLTKLFIAGLFSLFTVQCQTQNSEIEGENNNDIFYAPEWSKNAVIYEVNIRQHTSEGTFAAFTKDIPRIKELGADILWLMPIHPIGVKNRKGGLGSYYSVQNYNAVNPEYGTLEEFKTLIKVAHDNGLKVIIDWVANHSAWDNPWINQKPEFYKKDSAGKIITQFDWTDVAKFDYSNKELQDSMSAAMEYWVKDCDIDGYRCDVAFLVPAKFWQQTRKKLEEIKPVFMLAEMEAQTDINPNFQEYFQNAFNANYAWGYHFLSHEIAHGNKTYSDFLLHMKNNYAEIPSDVYKMHFLTNHDENSWNGTVKEKYGNQWKKWSILNYTLPQSFPLIYSGEEANNQRRLEFFEKDPITWGDTSLYSWYRSMNNLKHEMDCLANGKWGGKTEVISADTSNNLYIFSRKGSKSEVFVAVSFSQKVEVFKSKLDFSNFKEFTSEGVEISDDKFTFQPNSYVILTKKN